MSDARTDERVEIGARAISDRHDQELLHSDAAPEYDAECVIAALEAAGYTVARLEQVAYLLPEDEWDRVSWNGGTAMVATNVAYWGDERDKPLYLIVDAHYAKRHDAPEEET